MTSLVENRKFEKSKNVDHATLHKLLALMQKKPKICLIRACAGIREKITKMSGARLDFYGQILARCL